MKKSTVSVASVLGTGLVVAGLALTGVAAPAFAHTPAVEATCTELTINVTNYETRSDDATPNKITITIDGESDGAIPFGAGYAETIPFDETVAHTWSVFVDGLGENYDVPYEGTTADCITPTTPTDTPEVPDTTTPTPTPSDTPEPTDTPTPSDAPEPTDTPTPSDTPEPTDTPTPEIPAVPGTPETVTPTPETVTPTPTATTPAVTPTADSRKLAETGTDGAPVLVAGFLTVMAGAGVLLLARRLRRTQH